MKCRVVVPPSGDTCGKPASRVVTFADDDKVRFHGPDDFAIGVSGECQLDSFARQPSEIDPRCRKSLSLVATGKGEEVIDQARHTVAFGLDVGHGVRRGLGSFAAMAHTF